MKTGNLSLLGSYNRERGNSFSLIRESKAMEEGAQLVGTNLKRLFMLIMKRVHINSLKTLGDLSFRIIAGTPTPFGSSHYPRCI